MATDEQEDDLRVQRARDFLAYKRERENELRKQLAEAVNDTRRAKEAFEELFLKCEERARRRRIESAY